MPAKLDRVMGLLPASALVVGTMIGASIFVQPTEIARIAPIAVARMPLSLNGTK